MCSEAETGNSAISTLLSFLSGRTKLLRFTVCCKTVREKRKPCNTYGPLDKAERQGFGKKGCKKGGQGFFHTVCISFSDFVLSFLL